MAISANPPEFEERGIKPQPHGIPVIPRPAANRALARQVAREGVAGHDEASRLAHPDEATAAAMARAFVYPQMVANQFRAPQIKFLQAGTVALVIGYVLLTRIVPSWLNSRVRPMLGIPTPDDSGRVALPWGPADLAADETASERLVVRAAGVGEMASAARETATHIEVMQKDLGEMIGREGIEEPLLLVPTRVSLDHGQTDLAHSVTLMAVDGGSRATLAHGYLADVIDHVLDGGGLPPKRRRGLETLRTHLRGRLAGLLSDDALAERDLRDALVRLDQAPAEQLVASGLYRGQRTLVAPAMVLVAFEPHGSGTVLEAVQQMIGNQHKRGPQQWLPAARAVDTRDEMLRSLYPQHIDEGEMYLLGPRFEEAARRFGQPSNPDYRIGELVRLLYGRTPRSDAARRAMRDVMRVGAATRGRRAQIISAAVDEQLRTSNAQHRSGVEATLNDILSNQPIAGDGVPDFPDRDPAVPVLLADVTAEHDQLPDQIGPAKAELAAKGGVALALLGALTREYGTKEITGTDRPYEVLARMIHDPFGHELLARAIKALRMGATSLPKLATGTREAVGFLGNGEPIPMDGNNLRELFPNAVAAVKEAEPTEADLVTMMRERLSNGVGATLSALEELPAVAQHGLDPTVGQPLASKLDNYAERVKFLIGLHNRQYRRVHEEAAE